MGTAIKGLAGSDNLIGEIKAIDKDFPSCPTPGGNWKQCDGTLISDSNSPMNGYRIRNLNGATVTLSLSTTNGSANITVAATDITGISAGDDVSGTGIPADTKVESISGTTVTLSKNATATATNDISFTNNGKFLRGGSTSGTGQRDEMQGHEHETEINDAIGDQGTGGGYARNNLSSITTAIVTDGTNGPPRTGAETRPENLSVTYYMKIK